MSTYASVYAQYVARKSHVYMVDFFIHSSVQMYFLTLNTNGKNVMPQRIYSFTPEYLNCYH